VTARVAVIVPVHDQAAFLGRALGSLLAQHFADWEAVVVDDGSHDAPLAVVPADERISIRRHDVNRGLGAALNTGLAATTSPVVAYLPADDVWDEEHLEFLAPLLDAASLAWSGVRSVHGESTGAPEGHGLQLVQTAHQRCAQRWPEREQLDSDDLELLRWSALRAGGTAQTDRITCTWTDHPHQRHKAIRELYDGGVNVFRRRYRVPHPLRLHSTDSGLHDEVSLYARFRDRPPTSPAPDGLRVLLVGELAFNPERVLALEERGHTLLGVWTNDGLGAQTVGPLPFGHVTELPDVEAARAARPDVIYALLSWRAVPFAHAVRAALPHVPFVWHFKEAPQACLRSGTWPQLVDLCTGADQVLFSTDEERDWFDLALPGRLHPDRTGVLDGDLPKADWFTSDRNRRLSQDDGHVHTVVVGRPLGMDAPTLAALGRADVHVHLHGQVHDRAGAGPRPWAVGGVAQGGRARAARGAGPGAPTREGRPARLGPCAVALRRGVAAPVPLSERRRPAPRDMGRPQRPRAHPDVRRRRAADAPAAQHRVRRRR
jgi:glycosyltransferase involved in cell wall biosynthesis